MPSLIQAAGVSPRFLDLLSREPLSDYRVLDVGCGSGRLSLALAPVARSVVGLDRDVRAFLEDYGTNTLFVFRWDIGFHVGRRSRTRLRLLGLLLRYPLLVFGFGLGLDHDRHEPVLLAAQLRALAAVGAHLVGPEPGIADRCGCGSRA